MGRGATQEAQYTTQALTLKYFKGRIVYVITRLTTHSVQPDVYYHSEKAVWASLKETMPRN